MKEMYIIIVTVLLALWVINAEWQLECPVTKCPMPPGKYAVNLPHENDCTKFYKCDWGVPVEQECPLMIPGDSSKRLHYNRRLQVCDWPWAAGCESCPEKDENDECGEEPKISNPDDDCDTYYECIDGEKNKRTCPKDMCFSRTCQACVPNRKGGNCEGSIVPPCKEGNRKPNCKLYYECENREWISKSCSNGFLFNCKTLQCEQSIDAQYEKVASTIENRY